LLVVNGDIMTEVDYRKMLDFHREHESDLTVALRKYEMQIPFGVVHCEELRIQHVEEKPLYEMFVNAGMYLIEPRVLSKLPDGKFDMTDAINLLSESDHNVVGYPVLEYWLDIGRMTDLEQARVDIDKEV
jgi:NDP-sugar pyrophosphorylase family protein